MLADRRTYYKFIYAYKIQVYLTCQRGQSRVSSYRIDQLLTMLAKKLVFYDSSYHRSGTFGRH